MTGDRHGRVRSALSTLVREKGILGATLITRDGLCVINGEDRILSPETFSAMTATLMGAAETALRGIGDAGSLCVTAETASAKMVAVGAGDEMLLVIVGHATTPTAALVAKANHAAQSLRTVLAEA